MSSYYVLNSPKSTSNYDAEVTNWAFWGVKNGVLTVWQYIQDVPPNTYVKFDSKPPLGGACGLHIQRTPNKDPHGTYSFKTCQVIISEDSITVSSWSGPTSEDEFKLFDKEINICNRRIETGSGIHHQPYDGPTE